MCANKTGSLQELAVVGIDIGRDTVHLVGFDRAGQVVLRRQIKRLVLKASFDRLPRRVVGMEACTSPISSAAARAALGFEPRIIPAKYVKPFNKRQKNDYNDTEAISEAALRPTSVPWQRRATTSSTFRPCIGFARVSSRDAPPRSTRSAPFRSSRGSRFARGLRALKNSFEAILEKRRDEISPRMRAVLIGFHGARLWLDDRIEAVSREIEDISSTEESCTNIVSIPGIGPMISTAMVAAVGKARLSTGGVTLQPGSGWCHVRSAPAGERSWGGSPSGEAAICGRFSCRPQR